jgi:serine/threonine protein kinase
MAIESLRDWIFSSQSDVWSFGVVLWEIFSLAKVPYAGLAVDDEFILRLENGYRMEKPELMPENISRLMTDCWKTEPHQRPTFSQLTESLGEFTEAAGGGSRHLQIGNSNSQNSIKSFDGDVSPASHVTTRDAVAATAATNETAF